MKSHHALNLAAASPVHFVDFSALPAGMSYERYVFDSGSCPTRAGWHDFFNGICWLRLPLAKSRLNQLQAAHLAAAAGPASPAVTGGSRGRVRDAITVFDENGALLDAPPALWQALVGRDWHRLFVELRPQWAQARLLIFGHALLEKMVTPRKAITAHVWQAQCPLHNLPCADAWLAEQLTAERLAAKPFTPLPVLGIPGWWPENENLSFYDDSLVFRPRRSVLRSTIDGSALGLQP